METVNLASSNYGYSRVKKNNLQASQYTLVTLAVDESPSVEDFAPAIEKCVKEAFKGCKYSARADNLLMRTVAFSSKMREIHGFNLLQDLNESKYDNFYRQGNSTGGSTSLYDTCETAIAAMNDMGESLSKDDYTVNGIFIAITDGCDNNSTLTMQDVKKRLEEAKKGEKMESLLSILVAVNTQDAGVEQILKTFSLEAGFTQFVSVNDATDKKLARLAQFISKSVTSQSKQIGQGSASQPLNF